MIRIGMVGFGGYGWNLTQKILELSERLDCRLVAAADSHLDRAGDKVEQLSGDGVEIFSDAMEMFGKFQGRCDVIYIATSIHSHMPLTVAAAEAGYHVHLEKPPAATVQEVDAMIRAVDKSGTMCLVGFQIVHAADLQWVKQRIVAGRLGKIKTLSCSAGWPRNNKYYTRNEWAGKLRVGEAWVLDSPANNALAHQINNMLFWASDKANGYATPSAVRAELYAAGPVESHDTAAIEIQTIDGPKAYFIASHATQESFGPTITIDAELGRVCWIPREGAKITYNDGAEESSPLGERHHDLMIENLIEAVRTSQPEMLRCDLRGARNMTLALDGAHESSGCIHRIDPSCVSRVGDDEPSMRTVTEGLGELIKTAGRECCLFSDLDSAPPWAVRTETFDLRGYDSFPKKFRCS